jgi:hypothetical protein
MDKIKAERLRIINKRIGELIVERWSLLDSKHRWSGAMAGMMGLPCPDVFGD